MHAIVHFLLQNGIGQNVSAGVIMGSPTLVVGLIKGRRHRRDLHAKLDALHAKIDARAGSL